MSTATQFGTIEDVHRKQHFIKQNIEANDCIAYRKGVSSCVRLWSLAFLAFGLHVLRSIYNNTNASVLDLLVLYCI